MRAMVVAVLVASASCGSGTERRPAADTGPAMVAAPTGALTVFAAASLTESFNDLHAGLKAWASGLTLTYSFGSSVALVAQVAQGAPADIVATADAPTMKRLTDAGLVGPPVTFARNTLAILVAPGNPKAVRALADLARRDLTVVIADDAVPAGRYAAQALRAAGVVVRPVSKEANVKSAVAKVTLGEADATIVYVTDVEAVGARGQGVEIPPAFNVTAEYLIAIVKATTNPAGAAAFVDTVVNGAGQDALRRRGFRT